MPIKKKEPSCTFCGKDYEKVKKLISSPNEPGITPSHICDECVSTCNDILDEDLGRRKDKIFGIELERIKMYSDLGFVSAEMFTGGTDSNFSLVDYLQRLKRILEVAESRLATKEQTEIGQRVQHLRAEIVKDSKALQEKEKELEDLRNKLCKLDEKLRVTSQ